MKTIITLFSIILTLSSTAVAQRSIQPSRTSTINATQTQSFQPNKGKISETVSQRIDLRPGAVTTIFLTEHMTTIQVQPQRAENVHLEIKTNGEEIELRENGKFGSATTYTDHHGRWNVSMIITPTQQSGGGDPHYGWIELTVEYSSSGNGPAPRAKGHDGEWIDVLSWE